MKYEAVNFSQYTYKIAVFVFLILKQYKNISIINSICDESALALSA